MIVKRLFQAFDARSVARSDGRSGGGAGPRGSGGLVAFVERVLPIGIMAVALVGAPILIFSPEGLPRLRGLEREMASVEEENTRLEREIEDLRGHVERLRDDPAAVERIARDDLGLVRRSEVVFQFPPRR